jgi:hypothetical protein
MEAEGFVEGFVAQMIDTIDHCQTQLLYPRQYSAPILYVTLYISELETSKGDV